jgi:hypothetical protein
MIKKIEPKIYILIGIPVLFLAGGLLHFVYKLSGEQLIAGLFVPVNESVFEHIKMVTLPIFLWWGLSYLLRKDDIRADAWFTAALLSMTAAVLLIPTLYYFYTQAFGTELIAADIIILLIALGMGQLLGLHYYKYGKGIDWQIAITLMLAVIVLFAVFTLAPPKLPLFKDSLDGSYGLNKKGLK